MLKISNVILPSFTDSINEAVSRGSKQTDCTRVYSRRKYKQGNVHQGGELPHNDESGPLTA